MNNDIIKKPEYYINELSSLELNLATGESICVLDTLKALKRTGKAIRLTEFKDTLTVRTVFDHMLSLIRFARAMLDTLKKSDYDLDTLSRLIAYHEICEVLIGDIPQFSTLKETEYAYLDDERVRGISKAEREIYTSNFIKIFANPNQRKSIDRLVWAMENPTDKTAKLFEFMDTIDPIICVWRYIRLYRDDRDYAFRLIDALTDYFIYPHTLDFKIDPDYPFATEFIDNLCNKDNARLYATGEELCKCINAPNYFGVIETLIENTPIIFE